ncbi:hypothetical protein [Kibdelosporangium aridum]|uniref:Uncharacterized protein n=1 Tax=Kibdelosporangium aridum TaxID=2030 RepID=A0A1W2DUN1_KIBAR|nr:hypothetical protein [Kibdelosporangium aridum]SMD00756.1 hypothetical protein SAMN05661093_03842 [Kibdelosporangium aridum]
MPDGTPKPDPNDPAYQDAYQRALEEGRKDNTGGGWLGGLFETLGDMALAAEAGAFAVRPDVAQEVVKQLTKVQDQVAELQATGAMTAIGNGMRLGGGYATDISTFNQGVSRESGQLLQKFAAEIEELKSAVTKSIQHYSSSDSASKGNVEKSGGGL